MTIIKTTTIPHFIAVGLSAETGKGFDSASGKIQSMNFIFTNTDNEPNN
jgi:hypothetical protein